MLRLLQQKGKTPMIATAIRLQETTKEAVHDDMVMGLAAHIHHSRNTMNDNEFAEALYKYSALLASLPTTLAINVLLTEEEMNAMLDEIKEFEQLGEDITNGNN